ncbi:hypothetical protein B0F90DRAFT_1819988 [Multifurca ochricompacta]|uniref:Uncharacterized protein n=1 Tax=Multifurca ochricompacta TaxID=376703 RepID=A0AAD4QLB7_9AGAM|nr:hypothetical protein B0F90DRAFT_1819988 [Multifurca ochricompacta]
MSSKQGFPSLTHQTKRLERSTGAVFIARVPAKPTNKASKSKKELANLVSGSVAGTFTFSKEKVSGAALLVANMLDCGIGKELDSELDYVGLTPSSWTCLECFVLAAILRGMLRSVDLENRGPIHSHVVRPADHPSTKRPSESRTIQSTRVLEQQRLRRSRNSCTSEGVEKLQQMREAYKVELTDIARQGVSAEVAEWCRQYTINRLAQAQAGVDNWALTQSLDEDVPSSQPARDKAPIGVIKHAILTQSIAKWTYRPNNAANHGVATSMHAAETEMAELESSQLSYLTPAPEQAPPPPLVKAPATPNDPPSLIASTLHALVTHGPT